MELPPQHSQGGSEHGPGNTPGFAVPLTCHRTRIAADLSAVPTARINFASFLAASGVPDEDRPSWELAFTEAVTNAIRHGALEDPYLHVTLEWWAEDAELCLAVADPGSGPPNHLAHAPFLPGDPLAASGRGLYLIADFCDTHEHWTSPLGYRQILRKRYPFLTSPLPGSADLDGVLTELATAYECMSAFHRFGTSLISADGPASLLESAIENIALVQQPAPDFLRVFLAPTILPDIRGELTRCRDVLTHEHAPPTALNVLETSSSTIWDRESSIAGDPQLNNFSHGCAFPVIAGGKTLGCVVLAAKDRPAAFTATELSNLRTLTDLLGIALANANLQAHRDDESRALRELEIAADIQRTLLLPPPAPTSPFHEITLRHRSIYEVAGDYLEARLDAHGNLVLCTIDVMGKGVSAAMLAALFRTVFHLELERPENAEKPLGDLLQTLNLALTAQLEPLTTFITCALARVKRDEATGTATAEIASAGHCPVLALAPTGPAAQVEPTGPPLGLFADAQYTTTTLKLAPNNPDYPDTLLMVTDGLYEWNDGTTWWGWENLVGLAALHGRSEPDLFWTEIVELATGRDSHHADDMTLLHYRIL